MMTDRFKFRVWFEGRFIYKSLCDSNVYTEDGKCICLANILPDLPWEQCTGLKDKNGKLIYENDVVEIMVWDGIEEDMVETKGKVYWSKEDASFLIYVSFDGEYPFYGQEIKVIGNIHENGDLLK